MSTELLKLKTDILCAPEEKQKLICWILKSKNEKITPIKKKMCFSLDAISEEGIKIIKGILYENKIDMNTIYN